MSERIVERVVRMRVDDDGNFVVRSDEEETGMREEIVRCGDCGRAYRRGGGVYCSRVLQWGSNDRPAPLPVEPDGFCAWGERREA